MPDTREILAAMSVDDRALYIQCRTDMRRAFLTAHNSTVGIAKWEDQDDSLLDLVDIRLALLFDRSGRLNSATDIIGVKDGEKLHTELESQAVAQLRRGNDDWGNVGGKK